MAYDAYEFEQSLDRPAITVRRGALGRAWRRFLNLIPGVDLEVERVTYTGRLLSAREFFTWVERMEELEEGGDEEAIAFLKEFLLQIDIPPSVVLDLPPAAMQEALQDFFGSQARAAGVDPSQMTEAIRIVPQPPKSSTPSGSSERERTTHGSRKASRSHTSAASTEASSSGGGTES